MKILYAIQGTGNGHLSRAKAIIPILQKYGSLDLLVSGIQADIEIPYPITYRFKGLSFIFGKKGGVDIWKTYIKANSARLQQEIKSLPIETYDLVINDFEPVSAWACKLAHKPCISFSHQAAVLHPSAPKPKKMDPIGHFILKNYAPTTHQYSLHFKSYATLMFTPIIRQGIRNAAIQTRAHYTVYLPAYSDKKLIKILTQIDNVQWEVFSKHNAAEIETKNVKIRPITNTEFVNSMASCTGVLCGAGFETPAEALYMKKKLAVIPMKGQYEQQCNAAALKEMGITVFKSLKEKHIEKIKQWVDQESHINVDYPDHTAEIIQSIFKQHTVLNTP